MTRLWPGSLLGRNLLLLVLLVVASDISTFTIFFAFIQLPRIDEAAALFASQTKQVARLLSVLPPEIRYSELVATNGGEQAPPAGTDTPTHSFSAHRFLQTLTRHLPPGTRISLDGGKDSRQIWIQLRINDQLDWIMLPVPAEINHQLPWSVIAQLFTIAAFPALGAWLIQRYTVVRLQRLARAATTVTHGGWPEPVPVDGPSEFITVASTFNRMVASLAEMDATRTEMLAGISHDIRTPLTKLRMAIAAPEAFEAPSASAEHFLAEIDAIVEQFIDFARSRDSEPVVPGDLNALVDQLAADYVGLGYIFQTSLAPLPPVAFQPVGMQRVLMNMMHNAVIHGRIGLAVRTWTEPRYVVLSVEDEGPGVPEAQLPLVKQPFRRIPSPGREGGTGLGLAIAERIIRWHGGRLDLSLRAEGGLAATLRLPLK